MQKRFLAKSNTGKWYLNTTQVSGNQAQNSSPYTGETKIRTVRGWDSEEFVKHKLERRRNFTEKELRKFT